MISRLPEPTCPAAVIEACLERRVQGRPALEAVLRQFGRGRGKRMPSVTELRRAYFAFVARDARLRQPALERLLVRRAVRSLSGVAIVTVLTKPWPCPGRCVYCPSEARMPKSYLASEPAAARALRLKFDPYRQVLTRLQALQDNGHPTDKVELIVKGGTWSAYPPTYQDWFIRRCFAAANAFGRRAHPVARTLERAQRENESARSRLVGLTLETRPDRITPTEILRLRRLGCTRIELGVQALDDAILALVRRGHDVAAVVQATRLLKDAGFKVDYHLMPQLPGATPRRDFVALNRVFADERFRPDMIKIYPCVVLESAELHDWWRRGEYRPYADRNLLKLLLQFKPTVPRYCRISRLIRDIPSTEIMAGNPVTNLRETLQKELARRGLGCACLRCREIGHVAAAQPKLATAAARLFDDAYEASGGTEHFLSFEDAKRRAVFAFCRVRLPAGDTAFLRELHTYGQHLAVGDRDPKASQHRGLGRRLMTEAERIATAAGYEKMSVISGVGVRGYYRQLGYRLSGTYMVKNLAARRPKTAS